ncbi:PQQ-dependent sugar dehydrogenase [uncultured Porticoccus sp.]|uniref:PQQ-dependent sugar dehydrogenase n=1 Tax=uncultured Porticoccus sp. TaxID=1256050 RepID=UPI0030D991AD|tara:strand:+ start:1410 stop:2627 length:1218 start_codon:yes stop_codon:yes gene_type:complete
MVKSLKVLILGLLLTVLLLVVLTRCVPGFQISSFPVLVNTLAGTGSPVDLETITDQLVTPKGFELTLFADNIPNARFMKATPAGQLLVSSPKTGTVYLLADIDGTGKADERIPLITGLNRPHGLDILHDDETSWLYIAETNAVGRIAIDWSTASTEGDYQRLITNLPNTGGHWTRTIQFGTDGWLYLTVGSSCNVCEETDPRRAAMMRYRPDGSGEQIYATGLRNSVGFDWAPWDNSLYATDNGRDMLGDDFPPCELNRIKAGGFYGWPNINGFGDLDPDFGQNKPAEDKAALLATSISPVFGFRAHNAPLGMSFLNYPDRPDGYRRTALVALHGSWNRTEPDGYKVVALHWDQQGKITSEDFVSGFLRPDNDVIGRPVDIEEGMDGSIFISDDYAGAIYRVRYN